MVLITLIAKHVRAVRIHSRNCAVVMCRLVPRMITSSIGLVNMPMGLSLMIPCVTNVSTPELFPALCMLTQRMSSVLSKFLLEMKYLFRMARSFGIHSLIQATQTRAHGGIMWTLRIQDIAINMHNLCFVKTWMNYISS